MARLKVRKYAIGALTFSAALAIGFIVQYGDAFASRIGSASPSTAAAASDSAELQIAPVSASIATPQILSIPTIPQLDDSPSTLEEVPGELTAPQIILPTGLGDYDDSNVLETVTDITPVSLELNKDINQALENLFFQVEDPVDQNEALTSTTNECDVTASASATKMANVQLNIEAPCRPSTLFSVHHNGLFFDAMTDDQGNTALNIPALSENAIFFANFADGKSVMAETFVSDFNQYDRAVLQWDSVSDMQLHALEFGASYGDGGHIWRGETGEFAGVNSGLGGLMVQLGQGDKKAEIYTFPTGNGANTGIVALSVEAEVTLQNCGRDIAAQTLQIRPNQTVVGEDLLMVMPECNAIGEFIVLKNMFEDLTLAAK